MVAKLSTTIEKSQNLPDSSSNSITLNEFLFYMNNYSSERHPRIIIIIFWWLAFPTLLVPIPVFTILIIRKNNSVIFRNKGKGFIKWKTQNQKKMLGPYSIKFLQFEDFLKVIQYYSKSRLYPC